MLVGFTTGILDRTSVRFTMGILARKSPGKTFYKNLGKIYYENFDKNLSNDLLRESEQ